MLVGSTNQKRFKSVRSTLYLQSYINATCILENKNPSCCWCVLTVGSPLCPKASGRLQVAERMQFPRVTTVLFTPWWHCFIER